MTENKTVENNDLYHYTTQEGLIGILESNCLWATHYKFLNDYSEMVSVKEKIFEFYKNMLSHNQKINNDETILHINSIINKNTANEITHNFVKFVEGQEFYIASFCEQHSKNDSYINENGLLSQWRAYGGNGGYALIFNKDKLEELINNTKIIPIKLKEVIYSDDFELDSYHNSLSKTELDNTDYFVDLATKYKNCGFKEEREFRIVARLCPPITILERKVNILKRKFRCNNGEQIPYIELFNPSNPTIFPTASTLPIEKIIVGPHKDKEARATWLKVKLASIDRSDIEVTVSKIPFVGR
ncbi:MAG: DUF2971 domain-containing protein [Methylococcaceae bacterium]